MKKNLAVILLLILTSVPVAFGGHGRQAPEWRLMYDFYSNNSTLTFETEKYPTFKAPQPYFDIGVTQISQSGFWSIDVNWLMRIFNNLVLSQSVEQMADDDIHDVESVRIFRFRGGVSVLDSGPGKFNIAYNLLDWYKIDADNVEKDEYRAAGVGFGLGLGHQWLVNEHFCSHVAVCYNFGFNADAKELGGSSLADRYLTAEADCWYFLNSFLGLTAKVHYESHDFEQLVIKTYPTEGAGKVDIFTLQLGLTLAITSW